MVSAWLAKTSTALICGLAIASSTVVARPSTHLAAQQSSDAEQLHFDKLGNLLWEKEDDVAAALSGLHASAAQHIDALWSDAKLTADQVGELLHSGADGIMAELDVATHQTKKQAKAIKDRIHRMGANVLRETSVQMDGARFQRLTHPAFPQYALRISQESETSKCDPDVKSYSGYLDIDQDKHLWFAFFESRSRKFAADKSQEPIVMWLNGGPGCSSSTGWLTEGIGPCTVSKNGTSTKYNEHSWTNKASVFFLDQPVNVGYSYSESDNVNNTPDSADDVYAFLNMFFAKFSEYADAPFTVAAESYGGRYAPLIASKIFTENKARKQEALVHGLDAPKTINLSSIMIGNGLTDPKIQFGTVYEYACESKYAIFKPDSAECQNMKSKTATCVNLIDQCYKYNSRLTCTPAGLYCWSGLYGDAQNSGLNLYDVRRKCDRSPDKDGPLCYHVMEDMETYMNQDSVKKSYGVPADLEYKSCNMNVNQAFLFNGDGMHSSAEVLPEMIEAGLRVLVYAGEYDMMCSWIGNVGDDSWPLQMASKYQEELNAAKHVDWKVGKRTAGTVRQAGKGAGSLTLVKVFDAGHMVPMDQPEAAEAMIQAWLANKSIA